MVRNHRGQQAVVIDVEGYPHHEYLLEQGYAEIFSKFFPKPEDVTTLEYMKRRALGDKHPDVEYVFVASGSNLHRADKARVNGLSIALHYNLSGSGLFAYSAVDSRAQGMGLGRLLLDERRHALMQIAEAKGHRLNGLYTEVEKPNASEDPEYAKKRIKMFKHMGARKVDIDYVEPSMDPKTGRTYGLDLYCYDVEGEYPLPEDVVSHLRAMFLACGRRVPEADRAYATMEAQLLSYKLRSQFRGAGGIEFGIPTGISNNDAGYAHLRM